MAIQKHFRKSGGLVFFTAMALGQSSGAIAVEQSQVSSKVLYQAVDQLTEYMAHDLNEMSKHTKKTAVINYTQSEELPTSLQNYLIKKLEHVASSDQQTPVQFVQCVECTTLHAVAEGDEIFIRQGVTDSAQLKNVMDGLGIRSYSDVNLAYTGDQLVMQVSVVDQDKLVKWSEEYKTPYKAYDDSAWMLGANVEVGAFQGNDEMPAAKGARGHIGQRFPGVGAAGLSVSFFEEAPGVPQIISAGTYFALSHNEIFNQYWNFARLFYQAELGVTDFNGNQLFHETVGIKTILGKHYSVGLNAKMHQFVQTPTDDNPIQNDEGAPVLRNNEVLPMMVSLAVGVELL